MNKVYLHRSLARDQYLGYVDQEGKVFETRLGPDRQVGRVDLETGKVYETRLGPDRYAGRVDGETRKVYRSQPGPDEYIGRIEPDGALRLHKRLAPDEYLGLVTEMYSLAHAAGAFLLLVLPEHEEVLRRKQDTEAGKKSEGEAAKDDQPGQT